MQLLNLYFLRNNLCQGQTNVDKLKNAAQLLNTNKQLVHRHHIEKQMQLENNYREGTVSLEIYFLVP